MERGLMKIMRRILRENGIKVNINKDNYKNNDDDNNNLIYI